MSFTSQQTCKRQKVKQNYEIESFWKECVKLEGASCWVTTQQLTTETLLAACEMSKMENTEEQKEEAKQRDNSLHITGKTLNNIANIF